MDVKYSTPESAERLEVLEFDSVDARHGAQNTDGTAGGGVRRFRFSHGCLSRQPLFFSPGSLECGTLFDCAVFSNHIFDTPFAGAIVIWKIGAGRLSTR
jgi:hypothetical protein